MAVLATKMIFGGRTLITNTAGGAVYMHVKQDQNGSGLNLITDNGTILLRGLDLCARTFSKFYTLEPVDTEGAWIPVSPNEGISCAFMRGGYTVEFCEIENGILMRGRFRNLLRPMPLRLSCFDFSGAWSSKIDTCIFNDIETHPFELPYIMGSPARTVRMLPEQRLTGTDYVACRDSVNRGVFFGCVTAEQYLTKLTLVQNGHMTIRQQLEDFTLDSVGEEIVTDWQAVLYDSDANLCLTRYAELLAERMGVTKLPPEPTGWCTWYYYLGNISPDEIDKNRVFLRDHSGELPVRTIQIDDGWQDMVGDWLENETFSKGMKQIADEIRADGFLPGIWLCPFSVAGKSRIAREHPEYLLQRCDGKGPMRISDEFAYIAYAIDPTSPGGADYLARVMKRISVEWGYRYIKMDYMISGVQPGVRYDKKVSTLQSFRRGMEIIRKSVTPDTFLLSCTSPITPAIGLVDGMRISNDIFNDWNSLIDVFSRVIKRYFYHRKVFLNDADCVIIRKKENEDDFCLRNCIRTDAEIRVYLTCISAASGILMLSDKMPLLSNAQTALLSKLFPLNTTAARPLDLMESDCPGVLDFGIRGNTHVVALINWDDYPKPMRVEASGAVWEFWSGSFRGTADGVFETLLPPHDVNLLLITQIPDGGAAVIGTDVCLCPWLEQSFEADTLRFIPIKKGGTYVVRTNRRAVAFKGCTVVEEADGLLTIRSDDGAPYCEVRFDGKPE